MSGLISKSQLLACTMVMAAALISCTVNLYFLTATYSRELLQKYEEAVVTQTGSTWTELANRQKVSFPAIFKIIYSSSDTFDSLTVSYFDEEGNSATKSLSYSSMYWLLTNADCFGKVTIDYVNGKTHVHVQEVEY